MAEFIEGLSWIGIYFVVCASAAIGVRIFTKIPDEVFRKILHSILLGSLGVWTFVFGQWWAAALTSLAFAVLVYPILWLLERWQGYSEFITERKHGELKSSLLLVFSMFALVVAVCWGIFSDRYLVLASIYAWGFGDAAAALIGKRFGKHKFAGWISKGRKSVEGTVAMFVISFVSVFTVLWLRGGMHLLAYLLIALITAMVSAVVELFTSGGLDTVTCPLSAMMVLLLLINAFGGLM